MKKFLRGSLILIAMAVAFQSCNLDDFELDRLTDPTGLKPLVFAPLAYGTYPVSDFITLSGVPTNPVPASVVLNPIVYDVQSVRFYHAAVDSVDLIITFTNQMPVEVTYNMASTYMGIQLGKIYSSGVIGAGETNVTTFKLGAADIQNIDDSDQLLFSALLTVPAGATVTEANLLSSDFKVQISVKGPVDLMKIYN